MKKTASAHLHGTEVPEHTWDREKIWCPHLECFKYITVCQKCRVMIKCQSYQDYWFPRLDF